MTQTYLERLAARSAETRTVLCLGIDPDPASIPRSLGTGIAGVERMARLLVDAAAPFAAAVKPNLAFFEAFGSEGIAALERVRAAIPPGIPVVGDAKRGDIGTTAARQAAALYDGLGFDAITVSPYLGSEAIEPLITRAGRFAYVLCRTSNPGAGEFQDLTVEADASRGWPDEPLWSRVARRAAAWGTGGTVGLVVGATAPAEAAVIRRVAPGLAFLVPGIGAQGGDIAAVLDAGPAIAGPASAGTGRGLLVNVSRGIAGAAGEGAPMAAGAGSLDPAERLRAAAAAWAARLPVLP